MLRLTLSAADVVLVCITVDEGRDRMIVRGSWRVQCDECGRECWRAPGPPWIEPPGQAPRPAVIFTDPNVLLCVACATAHGLTSALSGF